MELSEQWVLQYLTKDGHVFVCPQYSIRGDNNTEWSCPDFVRLDFHHKLVSVIEVSAAQNPDDLLKKVVARERQWVERLKAQLKGNAVVDDSWRYQTWVFIRKEAEPRFRRAVGNLPDVKITLLDELGLPWSWQRSYVPKSREA